LDDGTEVLIRPLVPEDQPLLVEGFEHLSPESRYHRFFSPIHELGEQLLVQLTDLDYHDRFAWVAIAIEEGRQVPAAVARYFARAHDPEAVELAITVADEYQGRGIGSLLVPLVARTAAANGFRRLDGQVLAENAPMRALLHDLGARLDMPSAGICEFTTDLDSLPPLEDGHRARVLEALAENRSIE
jgi:acetyltransferase